MSVRDELITACARGDDFTVRRFGWWPIKDALADWWWSREPFTLADLTIYVRALGSYPPDVVLAALPAASDKWRPLPGPILAAIQKQQRDDERKAGGAGLARDKAKTPEALAAVAAAIANGEQPCGCNARGSQFVIDAAGVTRCPACRGIEQGQVYAMEDRPERQEVTA